jgi:hypothetical protein
MLNEECGVGYYNESLVRELEGVDLDKLNEEGWRIVDNVIDRINGICFPVTIKRGGGGENEFKKMKLATPVSEGWLFSKDEDTVKIFAGYDVEEDGSIHFSERSVFPTSCVKKITKIH